MNKKITIDDVARLAGVSIKTVSRVTNNEPNVRADTRIRVSQAIAELGYRPNPSARSLAARRSYLIGLVYDNPSPSYLINVQNGALTACRAAGYDLVIYPCDYRSASLADDLARMVQQSRLDGIVLTPPLCDMGVVTDALTEIDVPFTRVAPADEKFADQSVVTNDTEISRVMTHHLLDLGHRDIAFVRGHPDHGAVCNRYEGYRAAMAEAGIRPRKEWVVQGFNSVDSGEECARRLLRGAARPSAIFAANDDMAAGTLRAAHALGISVPGTLSVAGFDDTPMARQVWPALTTISQPIRRMAASAAELLLRRLRDQSSDDVSRHLECGLILRDTTAAAPQVRQVG
ncbi:MAG: LacI family DNA-binding transcriptional regulator [Pseudomonadota bacterium]